MFTFSVSGNPIVSAVKGGFIKRWKWDMVHEPCHDVISKRDEERALDSVLTRMTISSLHSIRSLIPLFNSMTFVNSQSSFS